MTFPLLPFALPQPVITILEDAYRTPPRAYHNLEHVNEVLQQFCSVPSWQDPSSVALAILFHDAIYEAGRTDNEARSADLAEQTLAAYPIAIPYDSARVRQLILLTARHGSIDGSAFDLDTAHFLDCDMAILGSSPERFRTYEQAIAVEYGHLPRDAYRVGRARFLQKLLDSPRIYISDTFYQRLEQRARINLRTALAQS